MKKFASIILSLLLICSLLACGGTDNTATQEQATVVSIPEDYEQYSIDDSLVLSVPNDWELANQEEVDAAVESVAGDMADQAYISLTFSIPIKDNFQSNFIIQRATQENLGLKITTKLLESSSFQSSILEQTKSSLEAQGFETEITGDYGMRTYGNHSFFVVQLTSKMSGLEIFQIVAMTVENKVIYNSTLTVMLEDSDYAEEMMPKIMSYMQWN